MFRPAQFLVLAALVQGTRALQGLGSLVRHPWCSPGGGARPPDDDLSRSRRPASCPASCPVPRWVLAGMLSGQALPRLLRSGSRRGDRGMATAEYAIATLAACGFAGLLLVLLRSDEVRGLLTGIVQRALSVGG